MPSESEPQTFSISKVITAQCAPTQTARSLDQNRPGFFSIYLGLGFRHAGSGVYL